MNSTREYLFKFSLCAVFYLTLLGFFHCHPIAASFGLMGTFIIIFPTELIASFAHILVHNNRNSEAEKLVNLGLMLNKRSPMCLWVKSNALINLERLQEAENTINLLPDTFDYQYLQPMWSLSYKRRNVSLAMGSAEKIIEIHPRFWFGYYARYSTLSLLPTSQSLERRIDDVDKLLSFYPKSYDWQCHRILLKLEKYEVDEVLLDAASLLKKHPKGDYLLVLICAAYLKKYDIDQSVETLNKLVELKPQAENTIYLRAWLFAIQDMFESALRDIENLSEKQPISYTTRFIQGWSLSSTNKLVEANKIASELFETPSGDELGHWLKGAIYSRLGAIDEALEEYQAGLKLNKYSTAFLVSMAKNYYMREEYDRAIRLCDQALSLNKYSYSSARVKSLCYVALHKVSEAEKCSEQADEIYCNDGFSWYCYGVISNAKNDSESALNNFSRAIELYSHQPDYYLERSKIYEKLGKSQEAEADKTKYRELSALIEEQSALLI